MSSVHFCGELARLYPDAAALVHSFATSASPPAQSQCPPFTKELNLDPVYLKSVDGFGKLRELIQNWHDECLASASPTILQPVEYHGANWVVIALCVRTGPRDGIVVGYFAQWRASGVGMCAQLTNFGTVLAPSILALGRSEKRASNSAGCFGEGMKVELERLVAGGAHVRILTGGCLWEFGYATVAESSCLVCRGQPYPLESAGHTSVVVDQLQVQADLARDYLFLRPPLPGTVASGAPVRFLLGEELAGKVFVRGILIKDYGTSRLPRLGLDFIGDKSLYSTIRLGRDRNDVDLRVIAGFVPTAFVNVADAGAKLEVAARIYDSVLECPTGDMSHIFETWCQPSQTTHGDDEVVADALVDAFRHRHPQGFPVERVADSRGESEMREAAYLLATPVPLPAELYRLLQRSPHMPTLDALWKQHEAAVLALPDWVPANQLQRETAERFVTVALEWFAPHLMLHQLRFKCFPAGTERAVVGAGGADGAVHYCVNIDQLQTAPVHVWQLRETGVRCINLERDPATGGLACGGACVLNRYQDALLTELKRRLGHTQARHLERNMRAAMLRRESRALPNVDLPPRADDTPGDEAGASRFHTSSPPPLGKSPHAAEPPRDPSAMSAKQLKQGLRDLGLDVVGLGPERADLEAAFREVASARAGPRPPAAAAPRGRPRPEACGPPPTTWCAGACASGARTGSPTPSTTRRGGRGPSSTRAWRQPSLPSTSVTPATPRLLMPTSSSVSSRIPPRPSSPIPTARPDWAASSCASRSRSSSGPQRTLGASCVSSRETTSGSPSTEMGFSSSTRTTTALCTWAPRRPLVRRLALMRLLRATRNASGLSRLHTSWHTMCRRDTTSPTSRRSRPSPPPSVITPINEIFSVFPE
mmetsp:Transcript_16086/g.49158  ORF Transcript_16086/g.49158 Transcript_16086/m.49158 type:complete len:880 (+) Transcript_16086:538-3177(+)